MFNSIQKHDIQKDEILKNAYRTYALNERLNCILFSWNVVSFHPKLICSFQCRLLELEQALLVEIHTLNLKLKCSLPALVPVRNTVAAGSVGWSVEGDHAELLT